MDLSLTRALNDLLVRHDVLEDALTWYAGASQLLFAIALLALLALPRTRSVAIVAAIATPAALLVAATVSALLPRARPFVSHPGLHTFVAHAADPGFPSDHAAASFAIATAMILGSRRIGGVLLAAAALLAVSRVAIGVHYPSDVLAGAMIGVLAALAAAWVWGRVGPQFERRAARISVRLRVTRGERASRAPAPPA